MGHWNTFLHVKLNMAEKYLKFAILHFLTMNLLRELLANVYMPIYTTHTSSLVYRPELPHTIYNGRTHHKEDNFTLCFKDQILPLIDAA